MAFLGNALINVASPLIHARLNPFHLRKCLFVVLCNSSPTSLGFSRESSSVSLPKKEFPVKALEDHFIPNSLWSSWRRRKAAGLDIGQKEDMVWQESHLVKFFKFTAANKKKKSVKQPTQKFLVKPFPYTILICQYSKTLKCFMSVLVFTKL